MAGIYVHIPFCEQKCYYCAFTSFVVKNKKIYDQYFNALYQEIKTKSIYYKNKTINTIYIGGGTPSCVDPLYIKNILYIIKKLYNVDKNTEITIECNPCSITQDKIFLYKQFGIHRFSIGLQVASNKLLKDINRNHTVETFINVCTLLQNENWNADVLLGIKHQTINDLINSINVCIQYNAKHISLYILMLEKHTPIFYQYINSYYISNDKIANLYNTCYKYLELNGYSRYEISNFAKTNFECRHNLGYWNSIEYIGFGISAVSYIDQVRTTNTNNFNNYINNILCKNSYMLNETKEIITKQQQEFEFIMLSLRTTSGIILNNYYNMFKKNFLIEYHDNLQKIKKFLQISNYSVKIKKQYMLLHSSIIINLVK